MLFISPPFGNYIQLPNTMSIKGSYTLEPRPGLILQILKTLRLVKYNGTYSWINKIGLRNPGIQYGLKHYNAATDIISIAIMEKEQIQHFHNVVPDDTNLEINISCPNTEKHMVNDNIQKFLNNKRVWCILKLSPLTDTKLIDNYYKQGFRQFHCCNTYPTENGGISGKVLMPYTNKLVQYIRENYKDTTIIAGGGIYDKDSIISYRNIGADHFSISTIFFHPIKVLQLLHWYYTSK